MPDLRLLEDQTAKALLAKERRYEREVQAALKDALDKMRVQMTKLYAQYAKDGVLTKSEMTRYNRLVTAERQLVEALNPALRANLATIQRLQPQQYQAAFFHYAWAIDNGAGVRLAWGVLNKDVILENIANQFEKISLRRYGVEARLRVRTALNDGLSQGKSYQDMARDLKRAIDTTYTNAIRIIRTEGQTAVNAGQEDAYTWAQRKGVEMDIIWDATLDGRTRKTHGDADGQKRAADGNFTVGGQKTPYPAWEGLTADERVQCRCRMRAQIQGFEPALRRTRDQGVIPYQQYSAWAAEHKGA
jgi:hypothetical protein